MFFCDRKHEKKKVNKKVSGNEQEKTLFRVMSTIASCNDPSPIFEHKNPAYLF